MTLRSITTAIFFSATAALAPAPLFAQITTFVAPPRKVAVDSAKTVAAATAKADTVARMKLTNMRAWVDSAAGVSTTQVASADTSTFLAAQPAASATANPGSPTTSFSNGAIAPNTASPLPFYFAAGFVLVLIGVGTLHLARRRV